jgi:hypothetical protein
MERTSVCAMLFILPCIGICNPLMEYLVMKTTVATVEDNATNLEICKKYCGACPTFKTNKLRESPPHGLFCALGKSSIAENVKSTGCYCPACEIFTKYHLTIGYFCTK